MSATPIPYTVFLGPSRSPDAPRAASGALQIRGPSVDAQVPALRRSARKRCTASGRYSRSALDVGGPGLFDQLDDRFRHRDVVELFSHLAALLERPFEELDGFLGG